MFHSSLTSAAAPDHLLTGLIKNITTVCFNSLSTEVTRKNIEAKVQYAASTNGVPVNGSFLKWSSDGKDNEMNSMEIISFFLSFFYPFSARLRFWNRSDPKRGTPHLRFVYLNYFSFLLLRFTGKIPSRSKIRVLSNGFGKIPVFRIIKF